MLDTGQLRITTSRKWFSTHLIGHNTITSGAGGSYGLHITWLDAGTAAPFVFLDGNVIPANGTNVYKHPGTYGSIVEINTE